MADQPWNSWEDEKKNIEAGDGKGDTDDAGKGGKGKDGKGDAYDAGDGKGGNGDGKGDAYGKGSGKKGAKKFSFASLDELKLFIIMFTILLFLL